MRRLIALFTVSFLFASCTAPQEPPLSPLAGHTGGYTAEIQATYGSQSATANLTQHTPDACTVTFTSPDAIKDMVFTFHQDAVDVSYRGITFPAQAQMLPGGAVASLPVDAINQAMQGNATVSTTEDGQPLLTGTLRAGPFQLILDGQGTLPAKLLVPQQELEILFTQFQFLDE